jgi:hypothetical protein
MNTTYLTKDEAEALEIMRNIGNIDERPIGFTSYSIDGFPTSKLHKEALAQLLNDNIDLSNYGQGISQIITAFVVYPNSKDQSSKAQYENSLISLDITLNYELLLIDSEEQAFERVKSAFFNTIKEVLPMFEIKGFDVDRFIVDLKTLFQYEKLSK